MGTGAHLGVGPHCWVVVGSIDADQADDSCAEGWSQWDSLHPLLRVPHHLLSSRHAGHRGPVPTHILTLLLFSSQSPMVPYCPEDLCLSLAFKAFHSLHPEALLHKHAL